MNHVDMTILGFKIILFMSVVLIILGLVLNRDD